LLAFAFSDGDTVFTAFFVIPGIFFILVGIFEYYGEQDKLKPTNYKVTVENIPEPSSYKCILCGKKYKSKKAFEKHRLFYHFPEKDRLEYDSHKIWKKGLYLVQKGKKVGLYLIPKGIIAPCEYDWISKFDNNSALLIKTGLNEKKGLCSIKTGKVRIPCEYQEIHQIKGNYFIVKLNNKYGIIEASLKEKERVIFDCKYDKIEDVGGNYVLLLLGGLYGAANFKTGELRFDCKYENIEIEKHLNTTFLSINDGDKVEYFNVSKDIYQEPKELYLERNENLEFAKWDRERDKKRKLMEQKIIENKERNQKKLKTVEDRQTTKKQSDLFPERAEDWPDDVFGFAYAGSYALKAYREIEDMIKIPNIGSIENVIANLKNRTVDTPTDGSLLGLYISSLITYSMENLQTDEKLLGDCGNIAAKVNYNLKVSFQEVKKLQSLEDIVFDAFEKNDLI
jgi:hypothetical protein